MTDPMVVIVCGSRDGARQAYVSDALDDWHARRPVGVLIHGDCLDPGPVDDRPSRRAEQLAVRVMEAQGVYPQGLSVDRCARRWGRAQRYISTPVMVHDMPADWIRLGDGAEPERNRRMAHELNRFKQAGRDVAVLAFPGGRGTENMVTTARGMGLPVWRAVGNEWRRDDG